MKKSIKRGVYTGAVILVSSLVLFASCARARWARASSGERLDMIVEKISEGYELDEQQEAEFSRVFTNISRSFSSTKEEMEESRLKLQAMILSDSIDRDALLEKYKENEAERTAKYTYLLDQVIRLHTALRQEQKEKLSSDVGTIYEKWYDYLHLNE